MKKKKRIYNYISALELLELKPYWSLDDDAKDRALYDLGNVKIPRSMLLDEKWQSLKPTAKSVYLHLLAKEEVIRKKRRVWIDDEETAQREGVITASRREIAKYTGIRIDNLGASIEELLAADLINIVKAKDGKKVIATGWQLAHWPIDKKGYVKMPLSVMISPAWQYISHETRILYIALLSEHCSQRKKQNEKFPVFTLSYNQIRTTYGLSKNTIRMKQGEQDKKIEEDRARKIEPGHAKTGIKALEDAGLIICKHGKYIVMKNPEDPDDPKKNDVKQAMNTYSISTDFMYETMYETQEADTDTTTENNEAIAE